MFGPFSSVSGYLDPEYSTTKPVNESQPSKPGSDDESPVPSMRRRLASSEAPYGTETTRKLWRLIGQGEPLGTTPEEIRLDYQQSYDYVRGRL